MLPSRFSAKLTWLNAVINGHSLKEEDYKVFETSGETRNPTIFNIILWVTGLMGRSSHQPSV